MNQQVLFGQLNRLGVNTQEALERFMGNEELFLSFICQLPEKLDFTAIRRGLEEEDEEAFYVQAQNLKGMAGNLGLTPLYECAQAILVEFRTSRFKHKNKLLSLVFEAESESRTLSKLISGYLEAEGKNI